MAPEEMPMVSPGDRLRALLFAACPVLPWRGERFAAPPFSEG
jgi:hypothetical protein